MNVYQYLSEKNPYVAKSICHNFGYKIANVRDAKDLGACLEQVVSQEGETALKQVMENHPDKEIIIELFGKTESSDNTKKSSCGCGGNCKCGGNCGCKKDSYYNFDGKSESRVSTSQTNTFIIASALLLAVAIISKNN